MSSSIFSLILVLDWDGWLTPRPDRFTPGKETRFALFWRLSGPQDRSGRGVGDEGGVGEGISPVPGFDPWTSEPVGICYTDCFIPAQ